MAPRLRVASATIHVNADPLIGNDNNDGITAPLHTIQRALDYASANFDLEPPFNWTPCPGSYEGDRPGIVIQMAPAPSEAPYILPQPAYLDGNGTCAPITLRGDPQNPLDYFIRADSTFQGLTSQNGARLRCEGFAIHGAGNCTLINPLSKGIVEVSEVWFGPNTSGSTPTAPMGAAAGSQLELRGAVHLWGSGFVSVFTAIEEGRIILGPNAAVDVANPMDFGQMFGLRHASVWLQGSSMSFIGAGLAGSTGSKFSATDCSFLGIHNATSAIPGTGWTQDSTSTVL